MNQRARLNLLVIQIFIASLMVALLGRLFYLQVAAGPIYKDAALSIQSRDVVTPANRGFIVDSSGVPLALNRVGLAITVDRTKIDKLPDKGEAVKMSGRELASVASFQQGREQDAGLDLASNRYRSQNLPIQSWLFVLWNVQTSIQVFLQNLSRLEITQRPLVSMAAMLWAMSDHLLKTILQEAMVALTLDQNRSVRLGLR
jgi:cell division protein FtsI/penicillin-binding protein 2